MDNHFTSEYAGQTVLSPLGLAMAVAMGVLVLTLPRRLALWPFVIMTCFVSQAQRIYVLGLNFDLIRVLIVCGAVRVYSRGEIAWFKWCRLDTAVSAWGASTILMSVIRVGPDIIVNRLGSGFDTFGMYLLFRCLLRGFDDLWMYAKGLMLVSIPVSIFFVAELLTGRNAFAAFGGVPPITPVRDGRMRCQGAFSHSILAGSFWAGALPLYVMGWLRRRKLLAITSAMATAFMIVACASATPISSLIVAGVGALCFAIRSRMRVVRWGIVVVLVMLHLVMNQPVWHLVARMGSLGGSAWHRFVLIDGCITHVNEWWAVGSSVGTAHWGHFAFDIANYYVVQAVQGGMIQLALFLYMLACAFGSVGKIWRAVRSDRGLLITAWAVGLALLVHALNLFGVSYFGQVWTGWYMTLAAVGSLSQVCVYYPLSSAQEPRGRAQGFPNPKPALGA